MLGVKLYSLAVNYDAFILYLNCPVLVPSFRETHSFSSKLKKLEQETRVWILKNIPLQKVSLLNPSKNMNLHWKLTKDERSMDNLKAELSAVLAVEVVAFIAYS